MIAFASEGQTMKRIRRLMLIGTAVVMAFGMVSCRPNSAPTAESQYSAKLPGDWRGTIGSDRETISFQAGGGFTAQLRPMGFISNTLGQGVTGAIRGTWVLQGKVITLSITSADNERLLNQTATSTIESFSQNEMVIKSAAGETSTFVRLL